MPTLSRPGIRLGGSDENQDFTVKFSGEVLAKFAETNIMMPLTKTRSLSGAKSCTFPVVGDASTIYHEAGDSVITDQGANHKAASGNIDYLSNVQSTEVEIFLDNPLTSSVMVTDIDELKQHWEARRHYSDAIARALSKEVDENIISTVFAAAKSANPITGVAASHADEGREITDSTVGTSTTLAAITAANLKGFAFASAETFDKLNVPSDQRYLLVRPAEYYLLAQDTAIINSDYTAKANGGLDTGRVMNVAGLTVISSNNFRSADEDAFTAPGVKQHLHTATMGYNADWTNVGAMAFTPECAGTVKAADLKVGVEYQMDRLATLIMATLVMGHGVLRESCATWLKCTGS